MTESHTLPLRASAVLRFKSTRERQEFARIRPALRAVLFEIAHFSRRHFDRVPVITHLLRTHAEQEDIYGAGTTKHSPHQDGRAADLRSRIYTADQVRVLVRYINTTFPRGDGYPTALYHSVGRGWHLHIQIAP